MAIVERRLYENIVSLFVLQGANYILPLITIPYLVRVLGPEKFGLLAFAQAFVAFFVIITNYGFNFSATRKIAIHKENPEKIAEIFSAVMLIKFILFFLGFIVMVLIVFFIPFFFKEWPVYIVSYLTVAGSVLFPVWFFQGMERMRSITIFNIAARALMVIGIFLWVKGEDDYIIAAGLQSIVFMLAGVLSLPVAFKLVSYKIVFPSFKVVKEEVIDGWHVFISTAAVSFYTVCNTFILGLIAGNTVVGYYSAADKLIKAVQGLLSPITQSIYPYISSMAEKSRKLALAFIHKSLLWLAILAILASLSLFVFAEPIVMLIFGKEFISSIPLVAIMAFLPFIIVLSNVFGVQTMLTFGFKREFSQILIGGSLINLLIIVPLILLFDATGVAISVLVTEILVTLMMGVVLNRKGIKPWSCKESFE